MLSAVLTSSPTQYEMDINNLRATEMIGELEYILCKGKPRYPSLLKLETRGGTLLKSTTM